MKATTLKNRLAELAISHNSNAYRKMKEVIEGATIVRTCHTSGSGRFTSNIDCTANFLIICSKLNVKVETGNDAPKGGLHGNFVKILTKIEL